MHETPSPSPAEADPARNEELIQAVAEETRDLVDRHLSGPQLRFPMVANFALVRREPSQLARPT